MCISIFVTSCNGRVVIFTGIVFLYQFVTCININIILWRVIKLTIFINNNGSNILIDWSDDFHTVLLQQKKDKLSH